MASASESSAMGGADAQNATKDVQRMGTRLPPPKGPDWQRRRGQTHQAAGAGSWSGRAALAVLPSWSVR
jgi:hypothetical protein